MINSLKKLEEMVSKCDDIISHVVKTKDKTEVSMFYVDNMISQDALGSSVIKSIKEMCFSKGENKCEVFIKNINSGGTTYAKDADDALNKLFSGFVVAHIYGSSKYIVIPLQGYEKRSVTEPPTSAVLKGPREGFTEDLNTNLSLIRKRLKTTDLVVKNIMVGKYTSTRISVLYIDSIADTNLVKRVFKRIKEINIDGIIDSFYVQTLIEERKSIMFKQIGNTEKPEIAVSRMLEGRIAIIVDGSPIILTVPYIFLEDIQNGDDYYSHTARAIFVRVLRLFGLVIAIILPGVYVALESFHYRVLPIDFLVSLMNSAQGLSFPPLIEILFVLFLFEILNEASIRMPKYLGMALSIVGALILGDTAVQANLISPPSVMMVAISGITLYTVPDQATPCGLLRVIFTVIGGVAGFYGLLVGFLFLTTLLLDFDSFGTPYFAPYAPTIKSDKKDGLFKAQLINMKTRPKSIPNKNRVRMNNGKDII